MTGLPYLGAIREKGFTWVDRQIAKPLPTQDAWLSLLMHLHPAMVYGLAAVNISLKKLDGLMGALYYNALPLLGIN